MSDPLRLFPYQYDGAGFLAKRDRAGLFDEPGVGKTAQAIRASELVRARRILIVCPAAVREVWRGEFRKFESYRHRIVVGKGLQEVNLWLRGKVDVMIMSYEGATKWVPKLSDDLIDLLVCDESHYLKGDSARTRAILGRHCDGAEGLASMAAYAWFLTGTPNPNDAADCWSVMRFCKATALSKERFMARYYKQRATAYSFQNTPRPEMLGELRQAIASFSIRRTKHEAGLQLPPIWLTTQTVDGDTDDIRALLRDYPGLETSIVRAVEAGGLSFLDAQHIGTLRRLVGEAKAPAFLNLLAEELDNGLEQCVVFGIHRRALDHLADGLARKSVSFVRVDGQTPDDLRASYVRRFQSGDARVFLGNIRAAGTGLTLTAAADVIMFESDWSPAANVQALMRVHRIGQDRAVRARFISLAGSVDEYVSATVARKTAAIAQIEGTAVA